MAGRAAFVLDLRYFVGRVPEGTAVTVEADDADSSTHGHHYAPARSAAPLAAAAAATPAQTEADRARDEAKARVARRAAAQAAAARAEAARREE